MIRLIALILLALSSPAAAKLSPNDIAAATIKPPVDARIPGDTRWIDQNDRHVRLGDLIDGKPVVLLFADYTCKHLCGPGMVLTGGALEDSGLVADRDVIFIVLGLDPKDGPSQARVMAARELKNLPKIARAAHLLSADPATVSRAEKALGFTAVYDPGTDQFAHDASAYIFNAQGKLAKLLPETALSPQMLRQAVGSRGAYAAKDQGFIAHIATVCYGFAAAHGIYGRTIVTALQIGGMLMILAFGLFFLRMARRRHDAS